MLMAVVRLVSLHQTVYMRIVSSIWVESASNYIIIIIILDGFISGCMRKSIYTDSLQGCTHWL